MTRRLALIGALLVASSGTALAQERQQPAQRRPPRRQDVIEIRGQVPTPQVVTVRPREAPAYNRRVLVPAFFDRDFWPSILPPLHIVSPAVGPRPDSLPRTAGDSAGRAPSPVRPASGIPPAPPR